MTLKTKITLTAVGLVALTTAATITTLIVVNGRANTRLTTLLFEQGRGEISKVVDTMYRTCVATESRNQRDLTHDLGVARALVEQSGGIQSGTETVTWEAVNQYTQEKSAVSLPKFLVGETWLGQVTTTNEPSPVVDEVTRVSRNFCTIFQRMNDEGDMLRVATSVVKLDGTRAVGTYIPRKNPDGAENPVVGAVLRGETYVGRAYVVNDWHATAYEPIWDAGRERVIGMLYIGIGMGEITRELHEMITGITVGKTGYAFVLGAKGDMKGKYIISYKGKRDGENIWEAKDAEGRLFIQSIVEKALKTSNASIAFEQYPWKNAEDPAARTKISALTYFAPWDWVIGAGAYEDDFQGMMGDVTRVQRSILAWVGGVGGLVLLLAALLSYRVSGNIARPLVRIIQALTQSTDQVNSAASQVRDSSQNLAEGASEQAASLEETSSSLEEMASMTRRNADNASEAKQYAGQARTAAEQGAQQMESMASAMEAIKASSDDIAKIIRTIDEIAFQTNILALNAAVEAARAGEAGMGFAVVADEVRNLAQRSAQAAKETAAKIEGAITRTHAGVEVSQRVNQALTDILTNIRKVDDLAAEVAAASSEQSQGIDQVNTAVTQVDKVTQSNAAGAEENASAAQELTSQATTLKQAVDSLQALVHGRQSAPPPAPAGLTPRPQVGEPGRLKAPAVARRAPTAPRTNASSAGNLALAGGRAAGNGDFKDF